MQIDLPSVGTNTAVIRTHDMESTACFPPIKPPSTELGCNTDRAIMFTTGTMTQQVPVHEQASCTDKVESDHLAVNTDEVIVLVR